MLLDGMHGEEDLKALKAQQMKDILAENNISFAGCFDESEILQKVKALWLAEKKPQHVCPITMRLRSYL